MAGIQQCPAVLTDTPGPIETHIKARSEDANLDTAQMEQNMADRKKSYHYKLGKMIAKVKKETKWSDIFKIVEEAQKKLRKNGR